MIKFLGAMLVILACTLLGMTSVLKKRKTQHALCELENSLKEMANAIEFSLAPLPDVICRLTKEQFTDPQGFLNKLTKEMSTEKNLSLSCAWQTITHRFAEENALPTSTISLMLSLGETLGKMDYETEINRLLKAAKTLSEQAKDMELNREKTEKAVKSLGVILGIFIVIILV